jgi:tocopherol O-methyltransferase
MKVKTNTPITANSQKLINKITRFWDKTSAGWNEIWGPHFHHGYFENGNEDSIVAQEKLIQKLAALLELNPNSQLLDVGCGIGGSSIYLAKHYSLKVIGVTLSRQQIAIATAQAQAQNIENVTFKIDDAHFLANINSETQDIVWSLESCEQFYDKTLFLQNAYRVLKPEGKLMLATWCSDREEFTGKLAKQYQKICLAFDTPYLPTIDYYSKMIREQNYQLQQVADWSDAVKQSWQIGLSNIKRYPWFKLFKFGGFSELRFLLNLKLMNEFFHKGMIRYGVFLAKK